MKNYIIGFITGVIITTISSILILIFLRRLVMKKSFEEQIKALSDIAVKKNIEAQNAVAEVTKLMQTKYPELIAEYSISDGGIIFIDDSDMKEYYNFEQIFRDFGEIK